MFLLCDENFDEHIANAVRRSSDHVVESVRPYAPRGVPDEEVLAVAARLSAVLLTHDISTLVPIVARRMLAGFDAPRVILVVKDTAPSVAAQDILIALGAGGSNDWDAGVIYVPL